MSTDRQLQLARDRKLWGLNAGGFMEGLSRRGKGGAQTAMQIADVLQPIVGPATRDLFDTGTRSQL